MAVKVPTLWNNMYIGNMSEPQAELIMQTRACEVIPNLKKMLFNFPLELIQQSYEEGISIRNILKRDNIDYTQGHTEKIRSLATLDRHLQISEVLARLEDVAAKTQDPNEQALLDLVREGYEEKRKSPENDLSGLNSFVDSTAALNLAKRIDLAIDDGEIVAMVFDVTEMEINGNY